MTVSAPPPKHSPDSIAEYLERRVPRIVVTGSESTGKTTLAAALADALGSAWIPEFSRSYAERHPRALTSADVIEIAKGQAASEDVAFATWHAQWGATIDAPPLILDTDLVSTTVYAEHYYGECPSWISTAAKDRLAPLYLLCEPDLLWLPDGVRDRPAARRQLHGAFKARLREFEAFVLPVHGTGNERLEIALAAVRGWRAARAHGKHP